MNYILLVYDLEQQLVIVQFTQGAHLRFWIVVTDAMGNIYPLQDVGALFQVHQA